MKYTESLPFLLNWPFIIVGFIVMGNIPPYGLFAGLLVFGYEFYRTRKIYKEVGEDLSPNVIHDYFSQDRARKYLNVTDQIKGLKAQIGTKTSAEPE